MLGKTPLPMSEFVRISATPLPPSPRTSFVNDPEGNSSKAKKSGNFVWSDDEVLLNVVLELKTVRTAGNVDWQTYQTKYADMLDLFRAPKALFLAEPFYDLQFALRATAEGERY